MNWMFFWGMVGLAQLAILPGVILFRLAGLRLGWFEKAGAIFGISLLVNYGLVSLLALSGAYIRPVMLVVVCLELAVFMFMYWQRLQKPFGEWLGGLVGSAREAGQVALDWALPGVPAGWARALLRLAAFGLGLVGVAWVLVLILRNAGGVFNTWDAILSWNRWAVAWAGGRVPPDTGYYPQLLPANWSLTYVLMGNASIQIFARAIGPIFLLMILLLQLGMGARTRSYGVLLGTFFTWVLCRGYLSEFIPDGYADLPAAFLGFLGAALLLRIEPDSPAGERRKLLWLSALMCAAAALTKQSGVYLLLVFPLLAAVLPAWKNETGMRRREILPPFLAGLALAGSFYLVKYAAIAQGLDESNVAWVTQGIFGGAGWLGGFSEAWANLGIYRWLFVWLIPALLFVPPRTRWLIAGVAAPYTLIWAAWFSYDTRNLASALPFVGLAAGVGLEGGLNRILDRVERLRTPVIRLGYLLLAGVLLLAAAGFVLTDTRLERLQAARQAQIISPQLDAKLYGYFGEQLPTKKIISQYPLGYLPGFEGKQVSFWFDNLADFLHAEKQPDVGYILLPGNAISDIQQVVEEKLATGEYRLIFEDSSYTPVRFFQIMR